MNQLEFIAFIYLFFWIKCLRLLNYFKLIMVTFQLMLMFLNSLTESKKIELSCWPMLHGLTDPADRTKGPKKKKRNVIEHSLWWWEREKKLWKPFRHPYAQAKWGGYRLEWLSPRSNVSATGQNKKNRSGKCFPIVTRIYRCIWCACLCVFHREKTTLCFHHSHSLFTQGGGECVCVDVGRQRTAVSGCGQCSSASALPNYKQVKLQQDLSTISSVQHCEFEVCHYCIWCQVTATLRREGLFSALGHVQVRGIDSINEDRQNKEHSESCEQRPLWKSPQKWEAQEQRPRDLKEKWKSKRGIKD